VVALGRRSELLLYEVFFFLFFYLFFFLSPLVLRVPSAFVDAKAAHEA